MYTCKLNSDHPLGRINRRNLKQRCYCALKLLACKKLNETFGSQVDGEALSVIIRGSDKFGSWRLEFQSHLGRVCVYQ